MCGIAGISFPTTLTQTQREELTSAFAFIAESMERRGTDSWGAATLFPDGSVTVSRGMGRLSSGHACRFEDDAESILIHTRLATQGRKVVRNAHFWHHGPLVLAHNGGVWDDGGSGLLKRYDCDSEALAHEVGLAVASQRGDIASGWEGYGSIHAVDTERHHVVLSRMHGGDLEWCRILAPSGGSALVWASVLYPATTRELTDLGFAVFPIQQPYETAVYTVRHGKFRRLDGVKVGMRQVFAYGRSTWDKRRGRCKTRPAVVVNHEEDDGGEWQSLLRASGYEEIFSDKHGYCFRHTVSGEVFTQTGEVVKDDDGT